MASVRSRSAGGRPVSAAPGLPFGVGQITAGARIRTLRRMRCARRLRDIPSAAIAFVQQTAAGQFIDDGVVALRMLGLPFGRLVPGQADRREIVELAVGDVGVGAVVEIFDAHQEATARRAGEQPRQHGGAQVADVQIGRRAGREPARLGSRPQSS